MNYQNIAGKMVGRELGIALTIHHLFDKKTLGNLGPIGL
jgi:hypothetical protein